MSAFGHGTPGHARLVRKLLAASELSREDIDCLESLPLRIRDFAAGADIVSDGDTPSECCVVLEGWVTRYKLRPQGQRQIFSFHIPGDVPDFQSLHLKVMDHSLCTLTPSKLAFIPHGALQDAISRPGLGVAFWRDTLTDAAVFREWMVGLGRRTAYQRIAHLFCELYARLASVGQAQDHSFQLLLTQAELADALGLTSVHVNRVMQELRRDELVATAGRRLTILDWDGLTEAGEFDPTYLHLRKPAPT